MIPAGYLLKRTRPPPGWLGSPNITDVCSVAGCVNDDVVVHLQTDFAHNAFGLANDIETLIGLSVEKRLNIQGARLFYYEAHPYELESDGWTFDPDGWRPLTPAPSSAIETRVTPIVTPLTIRALGFDVVTFGDFLEHSPLSCNSVAKTAPVNRHCLFDSLEAALKAIREQAFGGGCEEGVYKVFSVALVEGWQAPPA